MSLMQLIRKHAESLYDGRCTITEFVPKKGAINNTVVTGVAENIPCRVSYKSIPNAEQTATGAAVTQSIKLFLNPDVKTQAGSEVIVTQNGATTTYTASGEPAIYISHQEIELKLKKRWA